jgi:2-dehydropantoate 2-reductase
VNGWVIHTLKAHGLAAPINERVVELAYEIEAHARDAGPENAELLIETYHSTMRAP